MRLLLATLLVLGGCAPRLLAANADGGYIDRQGELLGLQQGWVLAEAHCRQFGKIVRVPLPTNQRETSFRCVAKQPGDAS